MDAPHGPHLTFTPWLLAVASLIPLAAAIASPSSAGPPAAKPSSGPNLEAERHPPPRPADAERLAKPALRIEPPDSVEPHRILVIGDSHTAGTFGRALDLLLRTIDESEVTTVGSCGLSPDGFLESKGTRCGYLEIEDGELAFKRHHAATPNIETLLTRHQPELTIVELGANQINTAMQDPVGAAADIRELANKVLAQSSRCLWVGPPYGAAAKKPPARIDHVYKVLTDALPAGCAFIDSRPSAMPHLAWKQIVQSAGRRGDGKHYDSLGIHGQHASRLWAMAVFNRARDLLKQPLPTRLKLAPTSLAFASAALFSAY